jgi:hypothetical protein
VEDGKIQEIKHNIKEEKSPVLFRGWARSVMVQGKDLCA